MQQNNPEQTRATLRSALQVSPRSVEAKCRVGHFRGEAPTPRDDARDNGRHVRHAHSLPFVLLAPGRPGAGRSRGDVAAGARGAAAARPVFEGGRPPGSHRIRPAGSAGYVKQMARLRHPAEPATPFKTAL